MIRMALSSSSAGWHVSLSRRRRPETAVLEYLRVALDVRFRPEADDLRGSLDKGPPDKYSCD